MKKLTAFVLSAMMVLSLAACGAKTETPADTSTPPPMRPSLLKSPS